MKLELGRRIERKVALIYYCDSKTYAVEIRRPFGRKWATRTYTPTSASLARVKRLAGRANMLSYSNDGEVFTCHSTMTY